jgi:integrase
MKTQKAPKIPQWFIEGRYSLPKNFPMTVRGDGYCKSFGGKTRWVCGMIGPKAAMARLSERTRKGDFDDKPDHQEVLPDPDAITVAQLSNLYLSWCRVRVDKGRPRKLRPRTYEDYRIALQAFADVVVDGDRIANMPAIAMAPKYFAAFAAAIPGQSPFTYSRYVAAVRAMYSWADENDYIAHPVKFGSDFKKASVDDLRVARADLQKAYTEGEIRQLVQAAHDQPSWLVILFFCLNTASSNADIGVLIEKNLTDGRRMFQIQRGKRGKAWRKCPLTLFTTLLLETYQRPKPRLPEYAEHVFLTRNGYPYVRHDEIRDENNNLLRVQRKDTATDFWRNLEKRAGVTGKMRRLSGLRTTFRTIAETMPAKDNEAIDLIMGHPRKHISAEYVENFPVDKLHKVVDHVWRSIFQDWSIELTQSPRALEKTARDAA